MKNNDIIGFCFRNLMRRKTRTVLAITGVIIGTCAIIVMLSIGFGLTQGYQDQIESYGNLHLINLYSYGGNSSGDGQGVLDDNALKAIREMNGVAAVSPVVSEYMTIVSGKYIAQCSVNGIDPEVMQKFGYETLEGRLLETGDKNCIVFGNQVPTWFYNPKKADYAVYGSESPVNVMNDKIQITGDYSYGQKRQQGMGGETNEEKIEYELYNMKTVGVLANPSDESSYNIYIPLEEMQKIRKDLQTARKESVPVKQTYENVMIYVTDIEDVTDISEQLREQGYQPESLNDWLESTKKTARMIQGILGGIGAISLFVAALGITNTMIMSIYERRQEIGVMKVIGANIRDIKKMFLVEAGMIGFFGGLLGIALSCAISIIMNTVLSGVFSSLFGTESSRVSIIPLWLTFAALLFATVVGLVSGYSPARRAMRVSALESLKSE